MYSQQTLKVKKKAFAYSVFSGSILTLSPDAAQANSYHAVTDKTPIKQSHKAQLYEVESFSIEPLLAENLTAPIFLGNMPSTASAVKVENSVLVDTTFENDSSQSKTNQLIDTTVRFQPHLGNHEPFIRTGINTFQEKGVEDITHFPLQIGIKKQFKDVSVSAGGGGDFFDRLPATPSLFGSVAWQAAPGISFSGDVTYESDKSSAASLENNIQAVRVTPAVYWQIDQATSIYSSFTWGSYSDGNQEQQVVANVERTFGDFFLKATAFYWAYEQDLDNGYFDPDGYSLYEGEVGWSGSITETLSCRIAASLGRQVLDKDSSTANGYKGKCTAQLSPTLEAGLGYYYSNTIDAPSSENNQRSVFSGHVKFRF